MPRFLGVVMGNWTKRPLNECLSCRSIWYPRGQHRSHQCPRCGSRYVQIAPTLLELVLQSKTFWIIAGGLLAIGLISSAFSSKNSSGSSRHNNTSQTEVVNRPADDRKALPAKGKEDQTGIPSKEEPSKQRNDRGEVIPVAAKAKKGTPTEAPKAKDSGALKKIPDPIEEQQRKDKLAEEERRRKEELAEEEKLKKEQFAESDAKFRLAAIKTLIRDGKPEVALRYAKQLTKIHPNTPAAKEAQAIISQLEKPD
jgi:hypothetical protein